MKKLACLLACAVLAGSFAACGGSAEQITMEPETSDESDL